MKTIALLLVFCSCNYGEERRAISALSARVAVLEKKLDLASSMDSALNECIDAARSAHDRFVLMNGGKMSGKFGGDVIEAPATIWNLAAKNKQDAIEECKTRYGAPRTDSTR